MKPEIIIWDYQFSPNAQKARNLLFACGIPFQQCEQPFMPPRPILLDLGITYRRIPVISIGKDVYCDSGAFLDAVQSIFPERALPTSPADHAYEAFGYRVFWVALAVIPKEAITPEVIKDRGDLFAVLSRPDFGELRPSALAEFKSMLDIVEKEFLSPGPWIGGSRCSMADIHAVWSIKWAMQALGVPSEPGFSKSDFPKVHDWIESLPFHNAANEPEKLAAEDAAKKLLDSEYAVKGIELDPADPVRFKAGTKVSIDANDDAKPGHTPQVGRLVGLGRREIVMELENGLRLHFPRIGYVVKEAQ